MRILTVLATLVLAALVAAIGDMNGIISALERIEERTHHLEYTIKDWDGDVQHAGNITATTMDALREIGTAKGVVERSGGLGLVEAWKVRATGKRLLHRTNAALSTLVGHKDLFDRAGLSPSVRSLLETERKASDELNAAIAKKVPWIVRWIAGRMTKHFAKAFAKAIKAYS